MSRIQVGEKVHRLAAYDELSLADVLVFDAQCADAGLPFKWVQVGEVMELMERLEAEADGDEEKLGNLAGQYPTEAALQTLVTAWVACRVAGDGATVADVAELPASKIRVLPDPQDKQGKQAPKAKGSKRPKVSVVADESDADGEVAAEAS